MQLSSKSPKLVAWMGPPRSSDVRRLLPCPRALLSLRVPRLRQQFVTHDRIRPRKADLSFLAYRWLMLLSPYLLKPERLTCMPYCHPQVRPHHGAVVTARCTVELHMR